MKKIISILALLMFLGSSFSFAADCTTQEKAVTSAQSKYDACVTKACTGAPRTDNGACRQKCSTTTLDKAKTALISCKADTWSTTSSSVNGITINEECLTNGQCKFNIYDTLGIRKSIRAEGDPTSVGIFVQDIVLSATFFIWTVVTVALIVSGLMYIFAAASGKDPSWAKKWIIWALIGLVIVACSYFIIRLVQYLAKGV